MAKITPQILFNKEKFIYGVDEYISGTVILPGVDLSTIDSLQLEHTVFYGISEDKEKELEGFYSSKKTKAVIYEIPLMSLAFSIPIQYPNLRKTQGLAFDDKYSLIQNLLTITVKEKSFFTLSDSEKIIVPIDWPVFENPDIMAQALDDTEDTSADDTEATPSLDELFPDSVLLPWHFFDRVSKDYYDSIISSSWIAKIGDMSYRHTSFKVLRYIAYSVLLGGFMLAQIGEAVGIYFLLGSLVAGIILFLQYFPKVYLKRKIDIQKYLPKLQKISVIKEKILTTQKLRMSDLFLPYQEGYQNPVSGIPGELLIHMNIDHEYQYQEGKHTNTHTQMLVGGSIYTTQFNTIGTAISDRDIDFPQWAKEILNMKDSYLVGLKKSITVNIMYDKLPDVDFSIDL